MTNFHGSLLTVLALTVLGCSTSILAQSSNSGPPLGLPKGCEDCPHDSYCDVSAVRNDGQAVCRQCTSCSGHSIEATRCSRYTDRVCRCSVLLGDQCGRTDIKTTHFMGYLDNAAEILASSDPLHQARFSTRKLTVTPESGGGITNTRPAITFNKPGVAFFSYHQDVVSSFDYLTLHSRVKGEIVTRELMRRSEGKWDGIATGGVASVNANDALVFDYDLSRTSSGRLEKMDNGRWGVANVLWISNEAGAETLRTSTNNAVQLTPLGGRITFRNGVGSGKPGTTAFQPQGNTGEIRFAKDGVVRYVFHQDISHACHNVKLRASIARATKPYFTLPGMQRYRFEIISLIANLDFRLMIIFILTFCQFGFFGKNNRERQKDRNCDRYTDYREGQALGIEGVERDFCLMYME